jgi:dienelactone hydrolase
MRYLSIVVVAAAFAAAASCGTEMPGAEGSRSAALTLHQDVIDTTNHCFGMHCCPSGYGMRGARIDQNKFLCRSVNQQHEDCFVDFPTQRNGIHACPTGTYMRGFHADKDLLTCCYERERGFSELSSEVSDFGSVEQNMHACPAPTTDVFMTGINVAQNKFLCSKAPATPSAIANPVNITLNPEAPRTMANFVPNAVPLATWQAAMRNWLRRIFNLPVNQSFLTAPAVTTLESVTVEGGVTRKKLTYPSPVDGFAMSTYLFLPANYQPTGSFPAVIVTHGHSADGKTGPSADWQSPYHATALYLAQNGFVTLAPDTRAFNEYMPQGTSLSEWDFATQLATRVHPGSFTQWRMLDNLVNVSVLKSTAGVDGTRLFSEGLSLGSDQAMWLAALDTRIARVIPGGLFYAFGCLNDPGQAHVCQTVPALSSNLDNPALNLVFDAGDAAALIAPRKLYVMWGDQDGFFNSVPPGGGPICSQTAIAAAQANFAAVNASGNLRVTIHPGMVHELDTTTSLEFFSGVRPADHLDYGNVCNNMHCCPPGQAMGGVHLDRNDFICRDMVPAAN